MSLVKICGLTRATDVEAAVRLGAWAVGFVLTESPRRVSTVEAAALAAAAHGAAGPRPPLTVGVFTVESAGEIARAAGEAAVDAIQLSAGGDGPGVAEVRAALEAAKLKPEALIAAPDCADADTADFLLYDSRLVDTVAPVYGGTGRTLRWSALTLPPERRVLLAGGIGPHNAGEAVRTVRPFAIDVSSGVETSPGVKDPVRMTALFAAVAEANEGREGA